MVEQLPNPIVFVTTFGTVTLTHRAWALAHYVWGKQVQSTVVLGVLDAQGSFLAYKLPYTDGQLALEGFKQINAADGTVLFETTLIAGDDYTALIASNGQGKRTGIFRIDDVVSLHKTIAGRSSNRHPY
jgi:hypothetical protein